MTLGRCGRLARCLLVWVAGTSVLAAGAGVVLPHALEGWSRRGSLTSLPLDRALSDLAAAVLLACGAWAWLALSGTVLEAGHGRAVARERVAGPWHLPAPARSLVLGACGVALVAGLAPPAVAGSGAATGPPMPPRDAGLAVLAGLPLPDRATIPAAPHHPRSTHRPRPTQRPPAATGARTVVVRPGDSLWAIAAHDLARESAGSGPAGGADGGSDGGADGGADAAVAARWHQVYAANRDVIGPDPDVISPGLRLVLPPRPVAPSRKDAP
jgi:hypothetical protein